MLIIYLKQNKKRKVKQAANNNKNNKGKRRQQPQQPNLVYQIDHQSPGKILEKIWRRRRKKFTTTRIELHYIYRVLLLLNSTTTTIILPITGDLAVCYTAAKTNTQSISRLTGSKGTVGEHGSKPETTTILH